MEEFWHIVEPDRPFVRGWAIEAICLHLEAVTDGRINRLLMNVPPGFCKSLTTDVFWPAWELGPKGMSSTRYLSFSYSSELTERDNQRFGQIISSPRYQELWGDKVTLFSHALGMHKVATKQTGWKVASSVGGVTTGARADRVIIDDPHNVKMAESETVRKETVRWFRESITSRLNDALESAIVVIMQRVHAEDVSGVIYEEMDDYCTLVIPMEFEGPWRGPTDIGWEDPRTQDGELAFPERFPEAAVIRDKKAMGPVAVASQYQQTPSPRAGNIIERNWWNVWPPEEGDSSFGHVTNPNAFPPCSLIIGSVDTAYGEKDENAFNAMTVWGVWEDHRGRPKIVLMEAWRKRLPLRGVIPDDCETDEERKPYWGLAEHVADTINRRNLDVVLIEDKTRGNDLAAEIRRLLRAGECRTIMIDPKGDKVARLHAVQAMFADGMIYAPQRSWAEMVIVETSEFPRSKYADLTDTTSQALTWLRNSGVALMGTEADSENAAAVTWRGQKKPVYDV